MKTEYYKIDMEIVKKTIRDNGFYYIKAEKVFDECFIGPKVYIVTDDPHFTAEHPTFADTVIMTVAEFEPIVQAINEFIGNEDKERHRAELSLEIYEAVCFDDYIENYHIRSVIDEAMYNMSETQKRRFRMRYFDGYTLKEISRIEKVSISSVGESLKAAERLFKKEYTRLIKK